MQNVERRQTQNRRGSIKTALENEGDELYTVTKTFIPTLRAILDCKFHEFMMFDNPRLYSRFVDFTYSWLGKFSLCPEKRTIVSLDIGIDSMEPEDARCRFFRNLIHPMCDKSWEAVTFREFLDERSSIDEIYFYLFCRNLLFKGPQLEHQQVIIRFNFFSFTVIK